VWDRLSGINKGRQPDGRIPRSFQFARLDAKSRCTHSRVTSDSTRSGEGDYAEFFAGPDEGTLNTPTPSPQALGRRNPRLATAGVRAPPRGQRRRRPPPGAVRGCNISQHERGCPPSPARRHHPRPVFVHSPAEHSAMPACGPANPDARASPPRSRKPSTRASVPVQRDGPGNPVQGCCPPREARTAAFFFFFE